MYCSYCCHSHALLSHSYPQIKPENIGFDVRGDVKIFDFGLMKSLDRHLKAKNGAYGYNLTAFTGSVPYVSVATIDAFGGV